MAGDATWVVERCPQCGGRLSPSGDQVVCPFCGSRLSRAAPPKRAATAKSKEPAVARPEEPAAPGVLAASEGLRLKAHAYVDAQGIGCEAFRLLIPSDWSFEGGVQWPMNNPSMPGVIGFRVRSPDGHTAFEVLPNLAFFWTNNPMVAMSFPIGSFYYGNEVRPPMPALQVLREVVLARYRGQMPALQIIGQESLPGLLGQIQASGAGFGGAGPASDGAKTRIRYRQADVEIEEELFAVVEVARTFAPTLMGMVENIFWWADYLLTFRAQAGQLDAQSQILEVIVRTFRMNPQWYNRYAQLVQYLTQNPVQQMYHVGQISQILRQASDFISEATMAGYRQQQQTRARIADAANKTVRGVVQYQDPIHGGVVELPGGYERAWTNSLDEYILTDDLHLDPNEGSNLNWQQMSRG
jgi:hypothetical protein